MARRGFSKLVNSRREGRKRIKEITEATNDI
jgi:hypothetical protein